MGSNQSSTISQTVDIVNETCINLMMSNTQVSSAVASVTQSLTIVNKGVINCGTLNVSQSASASTELIASFNSSQNVDISSVMKTAIDQAASSSNSAVSSFLASTFSDQDTNINIAAALKNKVEENVSMITSQTCKASAIIGQNQTMINLGIISGTTACNFSQNGAVSVYVSCLSKGLQDAVLANDTLSAVVQKAAAEQDAKASGPIEDIGKALSSIFGSFTTPVIIGIIAIVVVMLGLAVMKLLSGSKSSSSSDADSDSKSNKRKKVAADND